MPAPRSTFRASERRRASLRATLVGAEGSAEEVAVRDLSLGGMGIEGPQPLEVGARLAVSMDVPTRWEPLRVPAEVVWWAEHRGGLRFSYAHDGAAILAVFEVLAAQGYE